MKITKCLELVRNLFQRPSGGVRWTDLHAFGEASQMHAALNQRGQLYWTGYDGGNSVTLHYDFYSEALIVTKRNTSST